MPRIANRIRAKRQACGYHSSLLRSSFRPVPEGPGILNVKPDKLEFRIPGELDEAFVSCDTPTLS